MRLHETPGSASRWSSGSNRVLAGPEGREHLYSPRRFDSIEFVETYQPDSVFPDVHFVHSDDIHHSGQGNGEVKGEGTGAGWRRRKPGPGQ